MPDQKKVENFFYCFSKNFNFKKAKKIRFNYTQQALLGKINNKKLEKQHFSLYKCGKSY